jgi:hypothetical protein
LYARDPAKSTEGAWRGRLRYKKFEGCDDILAEYKAFQRSRGREWAVPCHELKNPGGSEPMEFTPTRFGVDPV